MIQRIQGMLDQLDMQQFNETIDKIRTYLQQASFQEIATPLIEPTTLFQRSLGVSSDVMSKELYQVASFHAKPEEQGLLALRPEGTASIMRAYLNNQIQESPWSVFTVGPMFRHERPQKGRFRQFTQASIEIINSKSISKDVHLIMLLERLFQEIFLLRSHALLINFMGCAQDRIAYLALLRPFVQTHQAELCRSCTVRAHTNILRIFDCKEACCKELFTSAPLMSNHLCTACQSEWDTVRNLLAQLSVSFHHAPLLVRGLDYYEKTVFEFVSSELGAQNTFCGGGRYNHLAEQLGSSKPAPSVGAAIGIERLILLLQDHTMLKGAPPLHMILPLTGKQHALALHLLDLLRGRPYRIDVLLETASVKSMLKTVHRRGATRCIIIGEEEQQAGVAKIKDMATGIERTLPLRDVPAALEH